MNHKHKTMWSLKKLYVMYFVYNDFIQSNSSNYWIKIDLDSK